MTQKVAIYGTNPWGVENRIYALYCPKGEELLYVERAKEAGWTELKYDKMPQPELWTNDPNPDSSASSAKAPSPTTRRRRSASSDSPSPSSVTRSSSSRPRERQTK